MPEQVPMPPEIDFIEQLYGMGEVSVRTPYQLVKDQPNAWRMAGSLLRSGVTALWLNSDSECRPLEAWEVAAIIRARTAQSGETTPPDDHLEFRTTKLTDEAYHRDFGSWFYDHL